MHLVYAFLFFGRFFSFPSNSRSVLPPVRSSVLLRPITQSSNGVTECAPLGQTTYSHPQVQTQSAKRAKQKAKRLAKRKGMQTELSSQPLISHLVPPSTEQGSSSQTPVPLEESSASSQPIASSASVLDLAMPHAPPTSALTQEQVQALIAGGIAQAQKPKAAWLASAFPVLPQGIETICEGMSERMQKETSKMLGTHWTKHDQNFTKLASKKKAKRSSEEALPQEEQKMTNVGPRILKDHLLGSMVIPCEMYRVIRDRVFHGMCQTYIAKHFCSDSVTKREELLSFASKAEVVEFAQSITDEVNKRWQGKGTPWVFLLDDPGYATNKKSENEEAGENKHLGIHVLMNRQAKRGSDTSH